MIKIGMNRQFWAFRVKRAPSFVLGLSYLQEAVSEMVQVTMENDPFDAM